MDLHWRWARFEELDLDALYDALALRQRVFNSEQNCAYVDADGLDRRAWHLLGRDGQGRLVAYLRIVDPGLKYPEPSIGRVVTDPSVRGSGAGRLLMAEGVAGCDRLWPGQAVRISAQAHLQRYYQHVGFEAVGDTYLEDGIPHIEMLRRAP
ncbi:GNAT family N-acetyltransferase [Ideonella sp. BN130291]|uniref:GNAT family N-acetyltransferase n=1 Tax=Ideonella sp. BN130291 TaxID=3112940 RepID=UPI002E275487|nr:GNAT family N-acetyltransferase [Ideonella sp. BN130291]